MRWRCARLYPKTTHIVVHRRQICVAAHQYLEVVHGEHEKGGQRQDDGCYAGTTLTWQRERAAIHLVELVPREVKELLTDRPNLLVYKCGRAARGLPYGRRSSG